MPIIVDTSKIYGDVLAEGMRFELTVGVDPLQRFSKPITGVGKMAKTLKSPEI
jgi:hypothetical protein